MQPTRRPFKRWTPVLAASLVALAVSACDDDGGGSASAAGFLAKAESHMEKGEVSAAVIELRNAVQKAPEDSEAYLRLGSLYLAAGDPLKAEMRLTRARDLGAPRERWLWPLGRALAAQSKADEVADLAAPDSLPEETPKTVKATALALAGWAAMMRHDGARGREMLEQARSLDPDGVPPLIVAARVALSEGDVSDARALAAKAQGVAPDDDEVISLIADTALAARDGAAAVAAYSDLVARHPQNPAPRLALAQAHLLTQNTEAAAEQIDAVLAQRPDLPQALYLKGFLAFLDDRIKDADHLIAQALAKRPDYQQAQVLAGVLKYRLGDYEQAARLLAGVPETADPRLRSTYAATLLRLGRAEEAHRVLAPLQADFGDRPEFLRLMSAAAAQSGRSGEARDYLIRATELDPADPGLRSALATQQFAAGDTDAAIATLREAVGSGGAGDRALLMLFSALLQQNEVDEALKMSRDVQAKRPGSAIGWTLEGVAEIARQDLRAARTAFQTALEVEPGAVAPSRNLAILLMQDDHTEAARDVLLAANRAHPQDPGVMTRLAAVADAAGDDAGARQWLEKAVSAAPEAVEPRVLLGRLLIARDKPDAALGLLLDALRATPQEPALLRTAGQAYLATGDAAAAADVLERLVRARGTAADHVLLAEARAAQGRPDAVVAELRAALETEPDYGPALLALSDRLLARGQADQAAPLIATLTGRAPDDPRVIGLDARLIETTDGLQAAISRLDGAQAARTTPDRALALMTSAFKWKAGDVDGALSELGRWLETQPEDVGARLHMATQALQAERYERAEAAYRTVLEARPDVWAARNNLAWVLLKQGRLDDALAQVRQARQESGRAAAVLDTEGMVLMAAGRAEEAVPVFAEAMRGAADTTAYRYHLAEALRDAGRPADAARMVEGLLTPAARLIPGGEGAPTPSGLPGGG